MTLARFAPNVAHAALEKSWVTHELTHSHKRTNTKTLEHNAVLNIPER